MAKIKGIELKNAVEFRGHEGEYLIQGNVYYNGKKVGYYSQDSWGGCDIFNLDYDLPQHLKDEINNITNNYVGGVLFEKIDMLLFGDNEFYNHVKDKQIGYEYLFMDLLQLMEHEKKYKKYSKKWHTNKIYISYYDYNKTSISAFKIENKDVKTFFEYNGLDDFVVV